MKQPGWVLFVLLMLSFGPAVGAQDGCETAFTDVQAYTAEVFAATPMAEGVVAWESTDWEEIVRRMVGSSEFYLNNCADWPLTEAAAMHLAELSHLPAPVEAVDVGGDFGDVPLTSEFEPVTEFLDLNADGQDELLLHTQVPYFSQETVYQVRGGLSIAFFYGEDGWQGQVIAPVTEFVTTEAGDHLSYAMVEDSTLTAENAAAALIYFPQPEVQLVPIEGQEQPLTVITLHSATPAGAAKELAILIWDDRLPEVKLRVAFDDWCYPGGDLNWEIRDDGSVYVPSNGGDPDSPLHCGQTPAALFQWEGDHYTLVDPA
jgi:hypothetical protein